MILISSRFTADAMNLVSYPAYSILLLLTDKVQMFEIPSRE